MAASGDMAPLAGTAPQHGRQQADNVVTEVPSWPARLCRDPTLDSPWNAAMKRQPLACAVRLVLGLALAAGGHAFAAGPGKVTSVEFTPTPAPRTEAELSATYTRSSALVTYADGQRKTFPLHHQVLFRAGDKIGGGEAGLIVDKDGKPILQSPLGNAGNAAQGPFFAYAPDANSLLRVGAPGAERLYLVTQYEYHTEAPGSAGKPVPLYAQLPMAMNLTRLTQNPKTGALTATDLQNIDMGPIRGLWIPCAASLTPWNTHLAGEEYEPFAALFEDQPLEPMNLFLGTPGKTAAQGGANPYDYGHLVEVTVSADGKAEAVKHYATGRMASELAQVMPDERTAYFGDDGRDVALFMFVADRARDLSAGTLYAARWEQLDGANGGLANLKWIKLGHASDAEIKAIVAKGTRFSDIFETVDAATWKDNSELAKHYQPVYVYRGSAVSSKPGAGVKDQVEYLKLKPGMQQAAAFLETRRYAATLGATTEFTKMEGVTHNRADRKLYIAMSYIEAGMLDGKNSPRPQDHIRLQGEAKGLACGAVYEANLSGAQKDLNGAAIQSEWVANTLRALVQGAQAPSGTRAYGQHDTCDTDRMANPDNIKYSEEMRTLFIGEDSGNHLNNFLWAYSVDRGTLTRLLSAPAGAEHTGLQVVNGLNGHSYILGNIQHPGAAGDLKKYPDEIKLQLRAKIDQRGAIEAPGRFFTRAAGAAARRAP
jgi:secreted PhoX family phosphatase